MVEEDDIVEVYDLAFKAIKVTENPHMPQVDDNDTHWFCTFSNDAVEFDFYLSLEGNDAVPSPQFAMSFIRADIGTFKSCDGFAAFAGLLGLDEGDERVEVAYNEISRLNDQIDALLAMEPKSKAAPVI